MIYRFPTSITFLLSLLFCGTVTPVDFANAASCTDGLDCFCDCAASPGTAGTYANSSCQTKGLPRQARVAFCDDFEDAGYTALTGTNSWTAPSSCSLNQFPETHIRGGGSLFAQRYGGTSADCGWSNGEPASPTHGLPCDSQPGYCGGNCKIAGWLLGDPLQAGDQSCMAILRAGDIGSFIPGATKPSQPLAGSNTMNLTVQVGIGRTNGLWDKALTGNNHTLAYSRLTAYPDNIIASKLLRRPWKTDQCLTNGAHPFGGSAADDLSRWPYDNMNIYYANSTDCSSARSGAAYNLGTIANTECSGGSAFRYDGIGYSQPMDWPFGEGRCERGVLKGMGTASISIEIWIDSKKIVDISGLDTRNVLNGALCDLGLNAFSNGNQGLPGEIPTEIKSGRFYDNLLVQSWTEVQCTADGTSCGVPPTCAQIEYNPGSQPPNPPPAAPSNLRAR